MIDELFNLMFREEWRNLPADRHPSGSGQPAELTWRSVAAALNAGEPGRARRLLAAATVAGQADPNPDGAAVTGMLIRLVEALDRNWFPGGQSAVLAEGDLDVVLEERTVVGSGPDAVLFIDVARFVEALPIWRRALGEDDEWALAEAHARLETVRCAGRVSAIAPVALAVADLFVRSGRPEVGHGLLFLARRSYRAVPGGPDRVGLAACALALGDWAADLDNRPETLSELLEPRLVTGRRPGDPRRAQDHWAAAERQYGAAGAMRGVVAVAVRRAALAVADGRPHDAVATLKAVPEVDDGALTRLVAVHLALATVQAGETVDHTAVGADLIAWAQRDGSRSYARGLARLCRARALRWQPNNGSAARSAGILAQHVLDRIGSAAEVDMLSRDEVDRYGVLSLHRAALVLAIADLDSGTSIAARRLEWMGRATSVAAASRHATALREPDALPRIDRHARALLARLPVPWELLEPQEREVVGSLQQIVAETPVLVPLWQAAEARKTAEPALARELLVKAEVAARQSSPLHLVSVLTAAGRQAEAAQIVTVLEQEGMPDEYLAVVYTRLGRYGAALAALDRIRRRGGPGLPMKPWELPQVQAEALLGIGRPHEAVDPTEVAVAEIERHLAALDLDVFRTMATDDPVVAGIYTTAVRVDAERGDVARSFERSDRSRAASLGDLLRPAGQQARAAGRVWQRAGAALARTIDEISSGPDTPSPAQIRARIEAAAREVDAADTTLANLGGVRRRQLPQTPRLADIQHRLAPETLLLQYHAYDDRLVAWAVTPDSARVTVERYVTADLTAAAFAFHRAAARPGASPVGWDAPLAPLLAPFTEDIRRCRRLIVVPHGPLASVPFHALPFDGTTLSMPERPVSYLPAASVAPDRPTGVRDGASVLVVGDPAYGQGYGRLPGTRVEAIDVAHRWGTTACLDGDATLATLLTALSGAGLVHLATHGSFRESSPYSTGLALADRDGLTVPDLMGVGMSADLVVLSACDSGRGRPTAAGDLIGLTRALLAAGARELVVSLWPVDDRIACLTMTAFHEQLRDRPASVGTALAVAQARIRSLTPEAADDAYAVLGGDPGLSSARRTNRDLALTGARHNNPADHCHWAPFVHVGTS